MQAGCKPLDPVPPHLVQHALVQHDGIRHGAWVPLFVSQCARQEISELRRLDHAIQPTTVAPDKIGCVCPVLIIDYRHEAPRSSDIPGNLLNASTAKA